MTSVDDYFAPPPAQRDAAPPGPAADGPVHARGDTTPAARTVLVVLVLTLTSAVGAVTAGAALSSRPLGPPSELRFYLAVPRDVALNYGAADAARHEAQLAISWIEAQTGGDLRQGPDYAHVIELPHDNAVYRAAPDLVYPQLLEDVARSAEVPPDVFPVILADLRTVDEDDTWLTCGQGSTSGLVVYLRNCNHQQPSTSSAWGSPSSVVLAHELLHGLGAVASCGVGSTPDGHVIDDPRDIMAATLQQRAGGSLTLDAGRDSYLDHGIPGCPDIRDSPLWEG